MTSKKRAYTINIWTGDGIQDALDGVKEFRQWILDKTNELAEKCADHGYRLAKVLFETATYPSGTNDVEVHMEPRTQDAGKSKYVVVASGTTTWFIEFGAGITYAGDVHPESKVGKRQMGPGTYPIPPGKGHWNDPNGWRTPSGIHTYGNPPAKAMYQAREEGIIREISRIVHEVFDSD